MVDCCAIPIPALYVLIGFFHPCISNLNLRASLLRLSLSGPSKQAEIKTFTMVRRELITMCTHQPIVFIVSLVDGFNLPMSVTNNKGCHVAECPVDLNPICKLFELRRYLI